MRNVVLYFTDTKSWTDMTEPDRNLLSMFSSRALARLVDFAAAAGRLKAIVFSDCVSTAFQWWRWSLGRGEFSLSLPQIILATSVAFWTTFNSCSHSLSDSDAERGRQRPVCVQMDEQNAGRLKISYYSMSQRVVLRATVCVLHVISSLRAVFRKEVAQICFSFPQWLVSPSFSLNIKL